jgi:hypothetical protein
MQMMPKINWPQRVPSDALAREPAAPDVTAIVTSLFPLARYFYFVFGASSPRLELIIPELERVASKPKVKKIICCSAIRSRALIAGGRSSLSNNP